MPGFMQIATRRNPADVAFPKWVQDTRTRTITPINCRDITPDHPLNTFQEGNLDLPKG